MAAGGNNMPIWARLRSFLKCESFTQSAEGVNNRKPAGWKAMPYVLGNDCFENLATFGMLSNFIVYLITQFHMDQVSAAIVVNVWSGTTNFAPLLGAYISDSYLGKFTTLAYASFATLVGSVALTLTAAIPKLHPPKCTAEELVQKQCVNASPSQLGFLGMSLALLTIGAGGIRPCSLPFGVDQFDVLTESGRKGMSSYFNWYYFSYATVSIVAHTLVVYVQTNVSWTWGLAIPTVLFFSAIVLFFCGTRIYIYVPPGESIFSSIAQVFVGAFRKRNLKLPSNEEMVGVLYDPPLGGTLITKIPLTHQFRNLNKAAIILDDEVNPDGSRAEVWKLCSIQQVEEAKCVIKVVPIWIANVICFLAMAQKETLVISQAMHMDRHIGRKFEIPAGSAAVISNITLASFIPVYDRLIVPRLEKITKIQGGITVLQRMGIGMVLPILAMILAGLVETKRRAVALSHPQPDGVAPMSVVWLIPQLVCYGLADVFIMIGQIEFYYKQFPEHMKSLASSIFFCTLAGSGYLSSVLVSIVHKYTGKHGEPNWLAENINEGRLEYFYFLIAGLGILNFVYFLVCASRYHYKSCIVLKVEDETITELSSI